MTQPQPAQPQSPLTQVRSVDEAIERVVDIYDAACARAREVMEAGGGDYSAVTYPKIVVDVREWRPIDRSEPFGYVN